jgi:hypothetical protein
MVHASLSGETSINTVRPTALLNKKKNSLFHTLREVKFRLVPRTSIRMSTVMLQQACARGIL